MAGRKAFFKNSPESLELKLAIDSVRLIGPQTAIEEGRAALAPQPPGQSRVMSRYTAVHVKQDGRWLMADVRDALVELPPETGQLSDLDWLVGSWAAGEKEVQLAVTVRWIENKQFLARNHVVTESGKETSSGLEIIGLDPSTGRVTSWTFSSDGGLAVGIWAPHENGWLIESEGVLADATATSATYVLSRKDNDTLVWKSLNRAGGEATLPDMAEVALKRK